MAMQPVDYIDFQNRLFGLVQSGIVDTARVDDAVRRILRQKFQLGLFEQPLADLSLADTVGCDSHRQVGRQAVRESLVLLKNDGLLPLSTQDQVLVAGFRGDDIGAQCGGWSISWQGALGNITPGTTILEGVTSQVGSNNVLFSSTTAIPTADVAIVVVGEDPYAEGAGDRGPGNPGFYISDADQDIIQAVKNAGIPMVVVLLTGRPIMLENLLDDADAVVAAWLPGTEGNGITDVLFGDFAPTGKLSHSWPQSEITVPINIGDTVYNPLFAYGYGLTYESTSLEADQERSLDLFPVPCRDRLSIRVSENQPFTISIIDQAGRILKTVDQVSSELFTIPMDDLPQGMYSLRFIQGTDVITRQILKQ